MRDFDSVRNEREQRDRTFKMAGREFNFKPAVTPETFAMYVDLVSGRLELSEIEAIAVLDSTIEKFLDDKSKVTWLEARQDEELSNPITSADMHELISFMWEVVSARPTPKLSASGDGEPTSGTTLTPSLPLRAEAN